MLNFETFSRYLYHDFDLEPVTLSYIGKNGCNIQPWSASLSMKPEIEQCKELERVLAELNVAVMNDMLRLHLAAKIYPMVQRVVNQLRQHYIYNALNLDADQKQKSYQVQSLYYLLILIYQGVVNRTLNHHRVGNNFNKFKQLIGSTTPFKLLTNSLYGLSGLYVDLLKEKALLYQRAEALYWQQLNMSYSLAIKYDSATESIDKGLVTMRATNVQDYYCQACLLSLSQPKTYRRRDILSLCKLLSSWANYLRLSGESVSTPIVFVALKSNKPPQYLTSSSTINPYDDTKQSIFIDLSLLRNFLDINIQEKKHNKSYRLSLLLAKALQQRTMQQENYKVIDYTALLVSGIKSIHYYLANSQTFFEVIKHNELSEPYQPKYNNRPKADAELPQQSIKLTEIGYRICRYQWQYDQKSPYYKVRVQSLVAIKRLRKDILKPIALAKVKMFSPEVWEIGIVRSIEIHDNVTYVEVIMIGAAVTACGIRLDSENGRPQDFVPALLLSKNEELKINGSVVLPKHYFKKSDKAVLRVGNKEISIQLQQKILSTDDIQQYTIKNITSK